MAKKAPATPKADKEVKTVKPKALAKTKAASPQKTIPAMLVQKYNVHPYSRFTEFDVGLFKAGKHYKLYEKFGSHVVEYDGVVGTYFAVWAPNAKFVSVMGNFNGWNRGSHGLYVRWDGSGIWEGFIPNIGNGEAYKYFIVSNTNEELEKADPFAL